MDILFVKLGALGDVINTLPLAVQLKKHMNATIHWLVAPLSYPIVSRHACVDDVILFDKKTWRSSLPEVIQKIRSQHFDLTLDLQRILKSGLFTMSAPSERRIGFDRKRCKEMTWLFPFERIGASDPHAHMLIQYLEFAKHLGVSEDDIQWGIHPSPHGPKNLPETYLVLNIGATKPANRWTVEGFASLADQSRQKFNMTSVITGGREDMAMAEKITAMSGQHTLNLTGKTSITDLIDVLNYAKAVVTCDTGPMHLAVALGRPVAALFGPSDPRRTGPFRGRVIQKKLDCNPCNKKQCDNPVCMTAITPEDVLTELEKLVC